MDDRLRSLQTENAQLREDVNELRELFSKQSKLLAQQSKEISELKEMSSVATTTATTSSIPAEAITTPATATTTTTTTTTATTTTPTSVTISQQLLTPIDALLKLRSNSQPSNLSHVEKVFTDHATLLAPLESVCPKIKILLSHLLTNTTTVKQKKARVSAGSEATRLHELTDAEAEVLGKSFKKFLLGNKEVATAVNAWKLDNPILEPLFAELIFEPIIIAIAKELMVASKLGLAKRVALGAGLSIMDMITDTGVINSYRVSGNMAGSYSLMAMIGSNMAVQLLFTYAQNRKKSKWVILREFAFVVTFLKPGVDAYRVATGHEDEHAVVSPLQEMALGKGTELAFESIPGGLLQAYVFINAPEKTLFLLISILISALTTGFASALISFDMDVSVANRKEVPLFYGYIKDSNTERIITFILQVSERERSGGGVVNRAKLTFYSLGADSARQFPQPQPHNRHRVTALSQREANIRRDPCRNATVPSLQGGEEGLRALGSWL